MLHTPLSVAYGWTVKSLRWPGWQPLNRWYARIWKTTMTKLSNTEGKAPLFCCGQQSQTWVMLPKSPCCSHTSSGRLWGLTGPVWLQGYWNYHRVTGVWSSCMSSHVSFLGGFRLLGTQNKEKVFGSGLCSAQPTNMLSPVGMRTVGLITKLLLHILDSVSVIDDVQQTSQSWSESSCMPLSQTISCGRFTAAWTGQQRSR